MKTDIDGDLISSAPTLLKSKYAFSTFTKENKVHCFGGKRFKEVEASVSDPKSNTILQVPLDPRSSAKEKLMLHLRRRSRSGRVDLLCNAAFQGSGKTVMLCLNMIWFAEETNGLAFHITFNDDQCKGFWRNKRIVSEEDFEKAVAVRMLHRLLENVLGEEYSIRTVDFLLGNIVDQLMDLISSTLKLVRSLLSAPQDTKILLAVDEISKTANQESKLTPQENLKVLVSYIDTDETFFLAFSAYGARC
jgi:hypothetical protein